MVRTPGIPARLEAFVFDQNEAAVDLHAQAESQALKCARGCQDGWVCTRACNSRACHVPRRAPTATRGLALPSAAAGALQGRASRGCVTAGGQAPRAARSGARTAFGGRCRLPARGHSRRWRPQGEAPRRLGLGAVRPAASVRAALPAVSGGCGARFASGARAERLRSGLILATYIQHDLDGLAVSSRRLV